MFSVRLLAGVALRVKAALIRERVCLDSIYLFLDVFLRLNWFLWVIDNSLHIGCNQCSVFNNVDSIPTEEVTEFSDDPSVANLPGVYSPVLKVFPEVFL